jgi:hypothetical protein
MSRDGWGPTLLGAVAAMAWLPGPLPVPPRYDTTVAADPAASVVPECGWAAVPAHSRPSRLLARRLSRRRVRSIPAPVGGGTVAG